MTCADDEGCPRCGAHQQATHHPLCQERDGTRTILSDGEVRDALARYHRKRFKLIEDAAVPDEDG
jgi:hypothetical protein